LTRRTAFVAVVDFFFDFVAELRVAVLLFGRHDAVFYNFKAIVYGGPMFYNNQKRALSNTKPRALDANAPTIYVLALEVTPLT